DSALLHLEYGGGFVALAKKRLPASSLRTIERSLTPAGIQSRDGLVIATGRPLRRLKPVLAALRTPPAHPRRPSATGRRPCRPQRRALLRPRLASPRVWSALSDEIQGRRRNALPRPARAR